MAAAGSSRPCSGACHEISHAIDALYPDRATHGEQVAGALFASFLREDGVVDELDPAYDRLGVARVPGDLGLTDDEFAAAVAEAPSTRPDRYTILEHPRSRRTPSASAGSFAAPSLTELRAVAQPESLLARRGEEHWAGRLYMRRVSIRLTRLLAPHP